MIKTPYPDYFVTKSGIVYKYEKKGFRKLKPFLRGDKNNRKNSQYKAVCVKTKKGRKNKGIHRLIAETKYGLIEEGYHVDHVDNNRFNNHRDNIQILSAEENIKKRWKK